MTVMEVLVGMTIMVIAAGAISFLVGAATQSKMTSVVRMADTETARESLEWMSERLRNAGFNLQPSTQTTFPTRCKDRVVAQDSLLYPTANAVYVSGEFLDVVGTTPGTNAITLGYYLGADPTTGTTVIMEYNQTCAGATSIAANSKPLSNPTVTVTGLTFSYYTSTGTTVSNLTSTASIQTIKIIKIVMTVQTSQGTSGTQTQTLTRYVLLRNPEPNANNWMDLNENF